MTMPSPMRVPADRPDGELEPETVLPCHPFRRDQNGTRHQVRLYDTELKRTA